MAFSNISVLQFQQKTASLPVSVLGHISMQKGTLN